MELYHLRTFVTIAEECNLTRAAQRLHTTPPAISAQVKALETELNIALFTRSNRGMALTYEGQLLRKKAEAALSAAQAIKDQAAQMQEQVTGTVALGINSSPRFLCIAELVETLSARHPAIQLQIVNSVTGRILSELENGTLDAGFIYGSSPDKAVATEPLCEVELAVAAPVSWACKLHAITWHDVAALPWIESSVYCPFQDLTHERFALHHVRSARIVAADDEHTKLELVSAGMGLALVEKHEALPYVQAGAVVLWEPEPLRSPLTFAYLARRRYDPLIDALLSVLSSVWS